MPHPVSKLLQFLPSGRSFVFWGGLLVAAAAVAAPASAAKRTEQDLLTFEGGLHHFIPPAPEAPVLDGRLGDAAWADALEVEMPFETFPGDNALPPVRTEVLLTYDARHLYVAFRAYDTDPRQIRARMRDRDTIFEDDHVGIAFDTFNDERRAFEFLVNPLGVQSDRFRDGVGGGTDISWDAIWYSAGRVSDHGYEVEMAIPFSALRFQSGEHGQTWGFDAFRSYPRNLRHSFRTQPRDRSNDCWICQFSKLTGLAGLDRGRDLEITPTAVAGRAETLDEESGSFRTEEESSELGLTMRWGFTPSLTLNATYNPDFSQIEADADQLEINRRFALFFPERRPFFLEGADFFETTFNAVHTRSIADPNYGAKVAGKQGAWAVGALLAEDASTSLIFPGSQGSESTVLESQSTNAVLRLRRDVGQASAVGLLVTNREGGEYSNLVAGLDGFFRLSEADSLRFQALGSQTLYPDEIRDEFEQPAGAFGDHALRLVYAHDDRNWEWRASYEDIGADFRADLGFMPSVDRRRIGGSLEHTWWGDGGDWWTFVNLSGGASRAEDQTGQQLHQEVRIQARASGPLQSSMTVGTVGRDRFFDGVVFDELSHWVRFDARPSSDVWLRLNARWGDDIDFAHIRPGRQLRLDPGLSVNLGRRTRLGIFHTLETLDVAEGELFSANLSQFRLVHQLNLRTFVRAIVQYRDVHRDPDLYDEEVDAETRRLLNQLLFSYKVNPRTVLFVGYSDQLLGENDAGLSQTDRSVFLKLGYAWLL